MKPDPFVPKILDDKRYVRNKTDQRVWHRCQTRALYADTDRSQVVYHGNYLRYFEYGRASLMRDASYPYLEIEESGYLYPIIDLGITFYSPLYYDDPMWIMTRPSDLERVRIRFQYMITHKKTGNMVCSGFTKHCAINSAGTPVGIDEKTLRLWNEFPR